MNHVCVKRSQPNDSNSANCSRGSSVRHDGGEMKQFVEFNINDYVKVKLTGHGVDCLKKNYDDLVSQGMYAYGYTAPKVDENGYSKFQMWSLMQDLGPYIQMSAKPVFSGLMMIEVSK